MYIQTYTCIYITTRESLQVYVNLYNGQALKSTEYISYCFSYFIYYIYNLEKTC